MQDYVSMVRNLVQSGQEYLQNMGDDTKKPTAPKPAVITIEKSVTVMEARCFNDSRPDVARCAKVLHHLVYLLAQGVTFTEAESRGLFFAITKLLQSEDPALRRATYTAIKEMRAQPSIYIVTSSLLKDLHHKNPHFRRNALRALPAVVDATNITQVERYVRDLMRDQDPSVAQAAMLSGLHFFAQYEEMVRKWAAELGDGLKGLKPAVQSHALALLADIKAKDLTALRSILLSLAREDLQGIAAIHYLRQLRLVSSTFQYSSPEASVLPLLSLELRELPPTLLT